MFSIDKIRKNILVIPLKNLTFY